VVGDDNVDDLAVLVDAPGRRSATAIEPNVRLINEPPVTDGMPSGSSHVDQLRREALHLPEQRHMVHLDTALGQELLQIPV